IDGMQQRGLDPVFAEQVFRQIRGFGEYGFPESHAASFALLVYISAWLKYYFPAAFTAALLNSQPMGFYAPSQLVQNLRQHGVDVIGVAVNHSNWDCSLEMADPAHAVDKRTSVGRAVDEDRTVEPELSWRLRLGFRLLLGVRREDVRAI